jgi:hypothetical protein
MRVALRAIADNSHFLGLDEGKICIVIVVSRRHSLLLPLLVRMVVSVV